MEKLICESLENTGYICLSDSGEVYRIREIIGIDNKDKNTIEIENYELKGDIIIVKNEVQKNKNEDDIQYLRKYYRKLIPTPDEIKRAKDILKEYKTLEEKQNLYLKIIGGRPKTEKSICIYDKVPKKELNKMGFKSKEYNGEVYEYVAKKGDKYIMLIVDDYGDYNLIKLIRVWKGENAESPICVTEAGNGIKITGEYV